ncbi:MAG: asparagine synthase C-terminal domain-containing protein [Burkholderiales bacterium]|nr:asparagine synthase C-terminal domain-containing protein [Burkholderiales bacterium]
MASEFAEPDIVVGRQGALACGSKGDAVSVQGVIAAISGHPGFLEPRLNAYAKENGIANALVRAYLEQGESVFKLISGPFSAAILDERNATALLAVDRSGIGTMSYAVAGGSLVFGASLDSINRHPAIKPEINRQAIYDYVYFHMIPGPETIYNGQYRLLPGECLVFGKGGARVGAYWEMHFDEGQRRPFDELKGEFLGTLRQAVQDAAQGAKTGAFLSGGTDSSTIAGMLGEVTGAPARTYSIGFEAEGYDEMEYARIAANRFGTDHHEYYVTPDDVASAIPRIAAAYDQPFGNSSAVPTYYCAKLAREDGMERLLGGDGGDELFGGNSRYAKQRIFSLYGNIPRLLRKSVIEPVAFGMPGAIPPVMKLRSYIEQASIPMPARLETYNLLERLGPGNVFTSGFLVGVDASNPVRLLGEIYDKAHAKTLINRMLALDLKFTLADNDLPKVVKTCHLAGVDIRFPLLADEVVAFSSRLDPELKLKGTKLRYFFKEALRGFLPDEIITKRKHGFGLPFGEWLKNDGRLQELGRDSLNSLKQRDIIRPEFVDDLFRLHSESHSGYYGTMVWVLMMLEQWFRHHLD